MMQNPYVAGQEEDDGLDGHTTTYNRIANHTEAIRKKCVATFGIGGITLSGSAPDSISEKSSLLTVTREQ